MEHQIIKPFLILLAFIAISITGCYYDNKQELYPLATGVCDTTKVEYAKDIAPIVSLYCGASGCHDAGTGSAGVKTNNYDNLKEAVNAGRLVGAINATSGFSPMPKGGAKMSTCNLNKIQAWINAKMPNN